MSLALWTSYQQDDSQTIIYNETDKYEILNNMDALDELCTTYGIPILSSMVDISFLLEGSNFLEDMAGELPPECSLPEANSTWTEPETALQILRQLLLHVQQHPDDERLINRGSTPPCLKALEEELQECVDFAQTAQKQHAKFRLEVV